MCKDLPKMVEYAKKKGILEVMFNTNGVLLTEKLSRKLIKAGLDRILLSFDSPIKEKYESIRIGAKFNQVVNNFRTLIRLRDEQDLRHPVFRVGMVKMKENKKELPDFVKLWTPIADKIVYVDYENPQQKDVKDRYTIKLKSHPNFVCSMLYQRLTIQYGGKIGLCCEDYDAKGYLGNARTDSLKEVWLGEKLQTIRRLHNEGRWNEVSPCDICNIPHV